MQAGNMQSFGKRFFLFSDALGEKKLTVENLWAEPRHERGKWKELLEKNLLSFVPFPLEKKMVDELLSGNTLNTKVSQSIALPNWSNIYHCRLMSQHAK